MLSFSSHITRLRISNRHLCELWDHSNGQNCGLCAKTVGERSSEDLLNKKCIKNQKLTRLWNMGLFQRADLWVVTDDNSAPKKGVGYWVRIQSVDNNCLKNQQLTALWTLGLFQRSELWIVPVLLSSLQSDFCQSIKIKSLAVTHGMNFFYHFQLSMPTNEYFYLKIVRSPNPNILVINF